MPEVNNCVTGDGTTGPVKRLHLRDVTNTRRCEGPVARPPPPPRLPALHPKEALAQFFWRIGEGGNNESDA